MALRTKKDYQKAFAVVREAINRWDPYSLIGGGSPLDEWESEVASVVSQIPRIRSPMDVAHVVSRVFSRSLEPEYFAPEACTKVGADIYAALVKAEVLE